MRFSIFRIWIYGFFADFIGAGVMIMGTYFGAGLINTGYAVQKAKYLGLRSEKINLKSVTQTSAGNAKIKWSALSDAEGVHIKSNFS